MKYVLPFLNRMKEIEFVLKIQGDSLKVLYSLFEKSSNTSNDLQRQPRSDHARGFPQKLTSYKSNCYKVPSLLEFSSGW